MTNRDPHYSLAELADLAGVSSRTVRYYQAQGLLPAPRAPGPGPKYGDADLARLRLIRRLQRDHLPLAEIRRRLADLEDVEISELVDEAIPSAPPEDSALDYVRRVLSPGHRAAEAPASLLARAAPVLPDEPPPRVLERSQWERITLATDVELHVRRPLPRPLSKQVDRLVSIARDLLEEDPS